MQTPSLDLRPSSRARRATGAPVLSGAALTSSSIEPHLSLFRWAVEVNSVPLAICACAAPSPVIIYVNPAFAALTGYSAIDLYGQRFDLLLQTDSSALDGRAIERVVDADHGTTAVVHCERRHGVAFRAELKAASIRNAEGVATHYVLSLQEAAGEQQHDVEQLRFLAHHDSLTGLPNRRLLLDRLDSALARYQRYGEGFALAFVDLNQFKQINDAFGHLAGDEVLKQVARRLASSIRACDMAGRLGGDEFVLLLTATNTADAVRDTLARVLQSLSEPLTVSGETIKATCSIGVAVCPRDGLSVSALLQKADNEMYRAKRRDPAQPDVHEL